MGCGVAAKGKGGDGTGFGKMVSANEDCFCFSIVELSAVD